MNSILFHKLKGLNISFKPISLDDIQDIHNFLSDKEVKKFIGWNLMKNLDDTREHIKEMMKEELSGDYLYASIVLNTTKEIIGTAMLFDFNNSTKSAELGYVLSRNHWGKGYGNETVSLITDFAFKSLKLNKLNARVTDANIASSKILRKNGYELEKIQKDANLIDGMSFDLLYFSKINYN